MAAVGGIVAQAGASVAALGAAGVAAAAASVPFIIESGLDTGVLGVSSAVHDIHFSIDPVTSAFEIIKFITSTVDSITHSRKRAKTLMFVASMCESTCTLLKDFHHNMDKFRKRMSHPDIDAADRQSAENIIASVHQSRDTFIRSIQNARDVVKEALDMRLSWIYKGGKTRDKITAAATTLKDANDACMDKLLMLNTCVVFAIHSKLDPGPLPPPTAPPAPVVVPPSAPPPPPSPDSKEAQLFDLELIMDELSDQLDDLDSGFVELTEMLKALNELEHKASKDVHIQAISEQSIRSGVAVQGHDKPAAADPKLVGLLEELKAVEGKLAFHKDEIKFFETLPKPLSTVLQEELDEHLAAEKELSQKLERLQEERKRAQDHVLDAAANLKSHKERSAKAVLDCYQQLPQALKDALAADHFEEHSPVDRLLAIAHVRNDMGIAKDHLHYKANRLRFVISQRAMSRAMRTVNPEFAKEVERLLEPHFKRINEDSDEVKASISRLDGPLQQIIDSIDNIAKPLKDTGLDAQFQTLQMLILRMQKSTQART